MDRKEYRAIYKCRFCGKLDDSIGMGATLPIVTRMALDVIRTGDARLSNIDGMGVQSENVHFCGGGNVGISDFIGFELRTKNEDKEVGKCQDT